MVDGQKPQTLLETLNVTNQDRYPNIYAILKEAFPETLKE
jgi:hypothetical protein